MKKKTPKPATGAAQALARGLKVLDVVAESPVPLTSTEIARRVGLHQSWVSRILTTLTVAGYVRKPSYHSFASDYGVLTLGTNAQHHFPLVTRPREALAELANQLPDGSHLTLGTLWHGQLVYLIRATRGAPVAAAFSGFPLHLSTIALRLLLELPTSQAMAHLEASRQRYGWERPTKSVAKSPRGVLDYARKHVKLGCLIAKGYYQPDQLNVTVPVDCAGEPRAALAIHGPSAGLTVDRAIAHLLRGQRAVETALRAE
ncbi:MAG TPA: helix-turn-helix domain-containing protein [Polyangiaceae bacterium]|nr:helix-turn-helix domain-containing protein [Polyangiaceae bacterium]